MKYMEFGGVLRRSIQNVWTPCTEGYTLILPVYFCITAI